MQEFKFNILIYPKILIILNLDFLVIIWAPLKIIIKL